MTPRDGTDEKSQLDSVLLLNSSPSPPKGIRFLLFAFLTSFIFFLILLAGMEVILRILGIGSPPSVLNPTIFQPDPVLGVVLKPGWRGVFAGVDVAVNSSGMRGPEIPPRKKGQYRILLVGDSFVFGYGQVEEETLRSHLETVVKTVLPSSETCVINGGVPGYNLVQDVSWTLHTGLEQMPDRIILSVVPNDLEPPSWLDPQTQPDQGDNQNWLEWIKGDPRLMELPGARRFNLVNLAQRMLKALLPSQQSLAQEYIRFCNEVPFATSAWPRSQTALLKLKSDTLARGIPLTVVLYPVPFNLRSAPFGPFNEKIVRFCKDSSIEVVDPSRDWSEIPESRLRWHPDDLHPSGFAHQLMAEYLVANIRF